MMRTSLLGVCVLVAFCTLSVDSAPTRVDTSGLVDHLKSLLSQRRSNSKLAHRGHGAVDLGNEPLYRRLAERARLQASYGQRARRGLSQQQQKAVVEYHNKLRMNEGASNMEKLRWSDRLAQMAQEWADRCVYEHRSHGSFRPQDYGFETIGENIYAWSVAGDKKIPDDPIQMWFDEKEFYDFNSNNCRKPPCGHYTQVTAGGTTHVGCGYTVCATLGNTDYQNGEYLVCNYGPRGFDKQPFKKGASCTQCDRGQFFCTDGMCDSTCKSGSSGNKCVCRAQCKQGSQTSDCKCQCTGGHTGPDCSEMCKDKDPQCGQNPGLPQFTCTMPGWEWVLDKCPKMCGVCASRRVQTAAEKLDDKELEFLIDTLQHNAQ